MAAEAKGKSEKTIKSIIAEEWLEEDNLILLEGWARDGDTYANIANKIGIGLNTLKNWRKKYPEIEKALRCGREIIDYKVENALLKSALGYKTKEVKVITVIKGGKTVETIKEVTDKEQSPNVSAIQCWLYNRLPDKWKKNGGQVILDDEDAKIQVTVTRATKSEDKAGNSISASDSGVDKDWQNEVNQSIEICKAKKEEVKQNRKGKKSKAQGETSEG